LSFVEGSVAKSEQNYYRILNWIRSIQSII
jgi:hypothetical protein